MERQEPSSFGAFGSKLWSVASYVPNRVGEVIDKMNTRLVETRKAHKLRPPRFTSFTMELEPYSLKKAFSLEILHEINSSSTGYSSESI